MTVQYRNGVVEFARRERKLISKLRHRCLKGRAMRVKRGKRVWRFLGGKKKVDSSSVNRDSSISSGVWILESLRWPNSKR
ncbi:hypothetical protein ACLOJK_039545 [Asimina triloba]